MYLMYSLFDYKLQDKQQLSIAFVDPLGFQIVISTLKINKCTKEGRKWKYIDVRNQKVLLSYHLILEISSSIRIMIHVALT